MSSYIPPNRYADKTHFNTAEFKTALTVDDVNSKITSLDNISSDLTVGGDTTISGDLVVSKSVSVTNADENTYTSTELLSFGEDDLSPTLRWSKSDAENCGVGASRTPSTLILTPVNYNDGFIEFYMGRSWSGDRNNNRGTTFRHYRDANFAGNDGVSRSPDRLDIFVSGDKGHSNGTSIQTVDAIPNITFTADNYVGINTKQPTYGLHVETEAYISSDLTVGGSITSANMIVNASNVTTKYLNNIDGNQDNYKIASYCEAGGRAYGFGIIESAPNHKFALCVNADISTPTSLLETDLNGAFKMKGTVTANGTLLTSDDRIKNNEQLIENATETLSKLTPQIYDKYTNMELTGDSKKESGLITQEVYYNAPELRHLVNIQDEYDASGNIITPVPDIMDLSNVTIQNDPDYSSHGWGEKITSLDYNGLIPYLIKSNQEMNAIIKEMKNEIELLQTAIEPVEEPVEEVVETP